MNGFTGIVHMSIYTKKNKNIIKIEVLIKKNNENLRKKIL